MFHLDDELMHISIDVEFLIESISGDMSSKDLCLKEAVAKFKKSYVDLVLEKVDGDTQKTTDFLNINNRTLYRIMASSEK